MLNQEYTIQKFAGKGGWHYIELPEIQPDKHNYFNWVRVKGSIDQYHFGGYNIMPMGNGRMMLGVNAAMRKAIKKGEGDTVWLHLENDPLPNELTTELQDCLVVFPEALAKFKALSAEEQLYHIHHIYRASLPKEKEKRIEQLLIKLT